MIIEYLLDPIFDFLLGFLSVIPNIVLEIQAAAWLADVVSFFSFVCYFLPMDAVFLVISTTGLIMGFRVVVSLIQTIWNLLPLL